jgi:hypothetical protein
MLIGSVPQMPSNSATAANDRPTVTSNLLDVPLVQRADQDELGQGRERRSDERAHQDRQQERSPRAVPSCLCDHASR